MIVGLGQTGLSMARHLAERGKPFCVADDYPKPEALAQLQAISPLTPVISIDQIDPAATQRLLLSPGVPLSLPRIQDCLSKGIEVTGDIALFSSLVKAPVAAVTGSNGKSTVTSMLGAFASAQCVFQCILFRPSVDSVYLFRPSVGSVHLHRPSVCFSAF